MLRHPYRALAASALVVAVLGILGIGVEGKLSPTSLDVAGTPSSRANQMLREHFGDSSPFVILLRGPAAAIDHQGPQLVRALRRNPAVTTLSPWDRGSVQALRPGERRAFIIADFHTAIAPAVKHTVPELERILEQQVHPPLRAYQTGFATLSKAIQNESIAATQRGELIALPILLVVLLIVFRSPVAALIPLLFGALTVIGSRGLLALAASSFGVDAFAHSVTTMMGLALGVDYSLLIVSRFREELASGAAPVDAARTTRRTAGRTAVFAGSTLLLAMIVALFIVPGALLASLAATLAMVVLLSVLVAVVPAPAVLTLVGRNIDRWRIGPAPNGRSGLMELVRAALRRPGLATIAIGLLVLVLATPAIALKMGPPSQDQLSPSDPARRDFELIDREIGPGWDAGFTIVAASDHGTMTEPSRLAALSRWQRRIAATPGVQAVIGPAQIAHAVAPLRETGETLVASNGKAGPLGSLGRLGRNLGRAAGGVTQLREGIAKASFGAGLLAEGSDKAGLGANAIASGLEQAISGGGRAVGALQTFASGAHRLASAEHRATLGALVVKFGVHDLGVNLRHNALPRSQRVQKTLNREAEEKLPQLKGAAQTADEELKQAFQQLEGMTVGKTDPNYGAALDAVRRAEAAVSGTDPVSGQPYAPGYAGLPAELAALRTTLLSEAEEAGQVTAWLETAISDLKRLSSVAKELSAGLGEIEGGGNKLASGASRLASAAGTLASGLTRLGGGATSLAAGISRLGGGATALQKGLAEGFHRAYPLQAGLRRAAVRVISTTTRLDRQTSRLRRSSPGLFDSGYFVLSALDGAPRPVRNRAATAIDINGGGQAATIQVISRYPFNSAGSIALDRRLERDAAALGREADASTGVAGGAAQLNDYSRVTTERFPYVIAAISIVTFLLLVLILRAVPLAAIAVGLNLATVAVAFGVLTLLFNVPAGWPLGGHTYVDAASATAIFGVVFGLSIDYAVFLLTRMRERYDADDGHADAIEFGLEKTARVITGAAAIMMAVFIAFAGAPIATVSQLGVGLTVAVLLDATVVRIVLLPALMLLLGKRVWWMPRSLERALPRLNV